MQIETQELEQNIKLISLRGRMDMQGTEAIDLKFTALTATHKGGYLIDLSQVEFIASIGIRTLLSNAKAANMRGGKMVLLNLQPMVADVMHTAGIDQLIPIFNDQAKALAEVRKALK